MTIQLRASVEPDRGQNTNQEINSQGDLWRSTINDFKVRSKANGKILDRPFEDIIFTGCGSTHYLTLAAAAAWQTLTIIRAISVPASELWLFPDFIPEEYPAHSRFSIWRDDRDTPGSAYFFGNIKDWTSWAFQATPKASW